MRDLDDLPRSPIDRLTRPFYIFAQNKIAGAMLLVLATIVAMVWANSPWSDTYQRILSTPLGISIGESGLMKPLILWINDGLMSFFFFLVGLEIKREILAGELRSPRKAALPIAAAIGGMVIPALVFTAFNYGGPAAHGWGIPMATDIAFALGVLLLLGSRVPIGLKVFLTALAIVDDIGAIVVIAVFYTDSIAVVSIGIGAGLIVLSMIANLAGVRNSVFYFVVGSLAWLAILESGVHATIAGVLMAMTIPARTRVAGAPLVERLNGLIAALHETGLPSDTKLLTHEQHDIVLQMEKRLEAGTAPLQQIEHALVPIAAFLIMPLFALANAGVPLGGDFGNPISDPLFLGIVAGLFIGKQIGVVGAAWLAVKLRLADLPEGVGWAEVHAVSILAGIGFTMSLFVSSLAFKDPGRIQTAKLSILAASLISAIIGAALLHRAVRGNHGSDE
jgi:NhaA family Na+:H+ antiporter